MHLLHLHALVVDKLLARARIVYGGVVVVVVVRDPFRVEWKWIERHRAMNGNEERQRTDGGRRWVRLNYRKFMSHIS